MNDLIRQAIAAEAEERVDARTVMAELHKRKKKPMGLIIGVATLTVAAAAAAFIVPLTLKKTDAAPASAPTIAAQNVLLVGTDDVGNGDAIVFVRFEADGSASAISLARNINVRTTADELYSSFRKNPQKMIEAIETLMEAKVDHYAAIRMSEFGKVAQAVGGVEVCLNAQVTDTVSGYTFPAGKQTLAGDQALTFLRQRFGLHQGDLDRVKRHQAFLAGLAAKITKDNALKLAKEISGTIQVDQGWDVLKFAERFQKPVKIRSATLPAADPGNTLSEGIDMSAAEAKQSVEQQFGGTAPGTPGCVN